MKVPLSGPLSKRVRILLRHCMNHRGSDGDQATSRWFMKVCLKTTQKHYDITVTNLVHYALTHTRDCSFRENKSLSCYSLSEELAYIGPSQCNHSQNKQGHLRYTAQG